MLNFMFCFPNAEEFGDTPLNNIISTNGFCQELRLNTIGISQKKIQWYLKGCTIY